MTAPALPRHLYVTWRQPSGSIIPVGRLTQLEAAAGDVCYRFVYLKIAEQLEGFTPLPGLPHLHRVYESERLFPVFANRQMPRQRPDYDAFVQELDLTVEADPFEVLARSEGRRMTDRIEVFAEPRRDRDGQLTTIFFARGVRHVPGAAEAITRLAGGEDLVLRDDPANQHNPRAVLLDTRTGESVGYVPDYLVETVHDLRELAPGDVQVTVEHVNPPTSAPYMRLLCRLIAPWPAGYEPFSHWQFQPIAHA